MMQRQPQYRGFGLQYPSNKIPEGKLRFAPCNRCGGQGGWMIANRFVGCTYCNGTGQVIRLKQTSIVRAPMGNITNYAGYA